MISSVELEPNTPTDEVTGIQTVQARVAAGDGRLPKPAGLSYTEIRELRKDPTIALCRELMPGPILAANWSMEATREDVPDEWVDFIRDNLMPVRDTLLTTTVRGLMDFGWQPFEKVFFKDEEGYTRIHRVKSLLQDYTDILVEEETGAFAGFIQDYPFQTEITEPKSLLFCTDVEGTNWYGQSRFDFAKESIEAWQEADDGASRYDRKVAGSHWVIKYPVGETRYKGVMTDNYVIAQDILAGLEASGGIIVPNALNKFVNDMAEEHKGWEIETVSDTVARQYSFVARLQYLDKCKVRAMGYPERAILEGNFGTKAESGVHANIAATAQDIKHRYIVAVINEDIVDQLLRINFGPDAEGAVRVRPAPITDANLGFLQVAYRQMVNNPEIAVAEHKSIDMYELRNKLAMPNNEDLDEEELQYERYYSTAGSLAAGTDDDGGDTGDDDGEE